MTPGFRVRVLAEHYDPSATREQAAELAERMRAVVAEHFPQAVLTLYVEGNPPADEVM